MSFKQILIHIGITLISLILISYPYEFIGGGIFETIYGIIHLSIILILYFISGYLITEKNGKFEFLNYVTIAIIGIILLITALIESPTDLNWKNGNGGIFWLIYRIYISGIETPFNAIVTFNFSPLNMNFKIFVLGIYSIIPSILITLGGYLKIKPSFKGIFKTRIVKSTS